MKVTIIIGLILVATAYLGIPAAIARSAGVPPQASFDVGLACFYLGAALATASAIGFLLKRFRKV